MERRYLGAQLRGLGQAVPVDPDDIGSNGQPIIAEDYFAYELDFGSLAFGQTLPGSILIDAMSDFLLQKACYFADIALALQTDSSRVLPLVTVLVTDSTSQRQLMSSAVPLVSLFGYGALPFVLPNPRVFSAQSQVQFSLANFSAATTYGLRLTLHGVKRFLGGGNRLS